VDINATNKMSVDSESRKLIARAICSYTDGKIDNFQFDDILSECRTGDNLCNAIIQCLWYFYDDCTRSRLTKNPQVRMQQLPYFKRWELLLLTMIDFEDSRLREVLESRPPRKGIWGRVNDIFYGRRPAFASNEYWPFSTRREWESLGISFEYSESHE